MISKTLKMATQLMLILLAGILIGFLLLSAVYVLPVEPMRQHVMASIPAWNGEWGKEDSYEQLVSGYITTQLDNSTDAAMMLAAIHEDEQSVFVQAAEGRNYTGGGNAFLTLLEMAKGNEMQSVSVSRYWHGYLVLLKPLLLVMSYLDIRMLLMLVQGAMLAAVIAGLVKNQLERLVPAFLISLIFITPSITGFSLQFSTALCTALGAMMVLLYLPRRYLDISRISRFFLLVGMVTSYVDYLTFPVLTLGWPLCLCLYLFPETSFRSEAKRFAVCCVCWAVGYFGMWAGKWVIAGMIGNEKWFWANLAAKIQQRSSGQSQKVAISYLDVIIRVCRPFCKRAYLLVFAGIAAAWLVGSVRTRCRGVACMKAGRVIALLIIALMPFVWYFVTKNHSYDHAFFTSRTLSVSAFALSCLMMDVLQRAQKPNTNL